MPAPFNPNLSADEAARQDLERRMRMGGASGNRSFYENAPAGVGAGGPSAPSGPQDWGALPMINQNVARALAARDTLGLTSAAGQTDQAKGQPGGDGGSMAMELLRGLARLGPALSSSVQQPFNAFRGPQVNPFAQGLLPGLWSLFNPVSAAQQNLRSFGLMGGPQGEAPGQSKPKPKSSSKK